MRLVDGQFYVRADQDAWTELLGLPEEDLPTMRGKWYAPPEDADGADCYASSFGTSSNDEHCFEGEEVGEVDGTPTRIVQCSASMGGTHKLYISALDEPVILRRIGIDDEAPFDVTLVDSDTGASIEAPPARDVIDGRISA